jgi:hypothetical protein
LERPTQFSVSSTIRAEFEIHKGQQLTVATTETSSIIKNPTTVIGQMTMKSLKPVRYSLTSAVGFVVVVLASGSASIEAFEEATMMSGVLVK